MNNPKHIENQQINEQFCHEESLAIPDEDILEAASGAGNTLANAFANSLALRTAVFDAIRPGQEAKRAWQQTPASRPSGPELRRYDSAAHIPADQGPELRRSNSAHI